MKLELQQLAHQQKDLTATQLELIKSFYLCLDFSFTSVLMCCFSWLEVRL